MGSFRFSSLCAFIGSHRAHVDSLGCNTLSWLVQGYHFLSLLQAQVTALVIVECCSGIACNSDLTTSKQWSANAVKEYSPDFLLGSTAERCIPEREGGRWIMDEMHIREILFLTSTLVCYAHGFSCSIMAFVYTLVCASCRDSH